MKWKFVMLSLFVVASLAVAANSWQPGVSQEKPYWSKTPITPGVTIPIKENNVPLNITIVSWNPSSLKGSVNITFPVYAPAGLKSCVISSTTTHYSYFTNPIKGWAQYIGSCETISGKKITIQNGLNKVNASIVVCPYVSVGDGVTTFNVTCADNAGRQSSGKFSFIIDKMAPYVVPSSIQIDYWNDTNKPPKITFTVEDNGGMGYCDVTLKTKIKNSSGKPYTFPYDCQLSQVSRDYEGIKKYEAVCLPATGSYLPVEILKLGPKSTNITCFDKVGNEVNSTIEKELAMDIGSANTGNLLDYIYQACKFAREKVDGETMAKNGYYAVSESGNSPELDNVGVYTFVYLTGENGILYSPEKYQSIVKTENSRMENDHSMQISRDCAGPIASCMGICGAEATLTALTAPVGGEEGLQVAKQAERTELNKGEEVTLEFIAKMPKVAKKTPGVIGKATKSAFRLRALKDAFVSRLAESRFSLLAGQIKNPSRLARAGMLFGRTGILAGFRAGGLWISLKTLSKDYESDISNYVINNFGFNGNPKTSLDNDWLDGIRQTIISLFGSLVPCSNLATTGLDLATQPTDIPDVYLIAPQNGIKANVTYMIYARIDRIDPAGRLSGNNKLESDVLGCFFGCPQYVCTVAVIPDKNDYNK